ncbi:MAG: Spy/CpxP family protein refolding chaperone [Elainella sp.]
MRFKPLILVPVLAGSCLVVMIGLTTFLPSTAQADAIRAAVMAEYPLADALERLDLTPTQSAQISQIRRSAQSELQTIVRPDQRQQFKQTWQQSSFQEAVAAMNLTADQRQQIRAVFQDSREQAKAVLTEGQRQELRQLLQERLDAAF